MISKVYGWSRVVAFASSDNLGTDMLLEFQTTSKSLGIDVVKSLSFVSGENDFTDLLNDVQPYDARIFAILVTDVADASNLLVQGFDSGVFNTLTMFFFTTSLNVSQRFVGWLVTQSVNQSDKSFYVCICPIVE